MLKYQLQRLGVSVALPTLSPIEKVAAQFRSDGGPPEYVEQVIAALGRTNGAYGHRIVGTAMSAIDLANAMASKEMQQYKPVLQSGQEILESYKRDFPAGTIT
jgi:hypothetical protein